MIDKRAARMQDGKKEGERRRNRSSYVEMLEVHGDIMLRNNVFHRPGP